MFVYKLQMYGKNFTNSLSETKFCIFERISDLQNLAEKEQILSKSSEFASNIFILLLVVVACHAC